MVPSAGEPCATGLVEVPTVITGQHRWDGTGQLQALQDGLGGWPLSQAVDEDGGGPDVTLRYGYDTQGRSTGWYDERGYGHSMVTRWSGPAPVGAVDWRWRDAQRLTRPVGLDPAVRIRRHGPVGDGLGRAGEPGGAGSAAVA